MDNTTKMVYNIIQKKADSNELLQAVSGVLGFPYTLLVDAGVCFTHYIPMLNEIRSLYGRSSLTEENVLAVLKKCKSEIFADILLDKLIGQVPVIGIAANIMCAKTLTWRLGVLFAMLAKDGNNFNEYSIQNAILKIRKVFPQSSMMRFQTPSINTVDCLIHNTVAFYDDFDVDAFFRNFHTKK